MANTIRAWLFPVMWFAYLAYWRAMADDVKADERVESPRSRLTRTLVLLLAVVLLWVPSVPLEVLNRRFLPPEFWWFWAGAGEWRALLAVVLVFEELFRKLRLEERWMRERFGAEYNAYTRRVAALVPFVL